MSGTAGFHVIVGAGHNGLVAACYLARAGRQVLVVERAPTPGGGSRTEERVPGYRFDLHSTAHNLINMTPIPAELDLAGAGLVYQEMDPFSVAVRSDGRIVRFFRSVDATVAGLAAESPADAWAYREFMRSAEPIVRAVLPALRGEPPWRAAPRVVLHAARALRRSRLGAVRDVLAPYGAVLQRALPSDLTRGPVAAFAAHASVGPTVAGGGLFGLWQAAYHLFGQWHARGGAQGLVDALVTRLRSLGGELRCGAPVARIDAPGRRVRRVVLDSGETIDAAAVVTAIDPGTALLRLLNPPLSGRDAVDLAAARRSNVVQALVHVATDRLPPYPTARPGDWNGLQSYVDHLGDLTSAWARAEAGELPDPLPLYAFTQSAFDTTLAPPGHHTVYLACPAAPARVRGGWAARGAEFLDAALDGVEARAPGFRRSIVGAATWSPEDMERESLWPGAHPMVLDLALGQLGVLRPTRRLSGWRTPVEGLYICGAGTNPAGGILGTPGRQAAGTLLRDTS